MTHSIASCVLAVTISVAACADDDPAQCEVGTTAQAVLAEDRKILGSGTAFVPDGTMRGRADELHRSQKLRREVAWQTIAQVLAPVSLNQALPNMADASLPAWQTWYARDDVTRLFQHLYEGLSPAQQQVRARFDQTTIDSAFGWNVSAVETLPNWPQDRWDAYIDAVDSPEKLAGIGGVARVGYSSAAVRHLLRSYPETLSCLQNGAPDAFTDTPGDAVQQAVREPLALAGCASRTLGPFYVTSGETLTASVTKAGAFGAAVSDVRLSVHTGALPGTDDCETTGDQPCDVAGAGVYYVTVTAGVAAVTGVVQVDYATANAAWAACLEGAFPTAAVVLKTSWHRIQFDNVVPTWDTSAAALATTLADNASAGWGLHSGDADPGRDDIYTMELPNGQRYRLAALHFMTKELDHWQWITMWWSDTPDSDFGEDRPAEVANLPGPWRNYKMCAATMFDERDPDPTGGFAATAPSLAAALASVHQGVGAPSWCSNPFLEEGVGNMATNCIGCHQHAGTDVALEEVISSSDKFPGNGNLLLRNNFPHDYSWAVLTGDKLGLAFKEVVDYFDAAQ